MMTDLFSMLAELFSAEPPPELLGQRIQQRLQVILAGLDERDSLSAVDMQTLRRELRMLLKLERIQVAAAELDKAEQVLQYMLRPNFEDCLNLWFGKSEQTDQEISGRFGADVALASKGHYDHWALDLEHPRLLSRWSSCSTSFRATCTETAPRCTPAMRAAATWSGAGCGSASANTCGRSSGSSCVSC